jgi:hypothetical protein
MGQTMGREVVLGRRLDYSNEVMGEGVGNGDLPPSGWLLPAGGGLRGIVGVMRIGDSVTSVTNR